MAWRFGACQTFLGSHLKFMGVNVKRPRQHACSHLSSDALLVSCFWCLVFLSYSLGSQKSNHICRASSSSVSMVFMDLPQRNAFYNIIILFSLQYMYVLKQ
jgi:hypothetical protein